MERLPGHHHGPGFWTGFLTDERSLSPTRTRRRNPSSIIRLSLDTGERHQLTSAPPHSYGDSQPDVSPDGRTLAFTRSLAANSSDIYIVPATGGDPRRLTFDHKPITGLAWTEDGQEHRLLVGARRDGGRGKPLETAGWRIDVSKCSRNKSRELAAEPSFPPSRVEAGCSPIRKYLGYESVASGYHRLRFARTGHLFNS